MTRIRPGIPTPTQLAADPALRAAFVRRFAPLASSVPGPLEAFPPMAGVLPVLSGDNNLANAGDADRAVLADNTGVARWTGPVAVTTTSGRVASIEPHGITGSPVCWKWVTDSPLPQPKGQFHNGSPYVLIVDGELVTATPRVPAGNAYERINWNGVRKMRHYELYANNGFTLSHIAVGAADSIYAPPQTRPLVGWMGDSVSQGAPVAGTAPADFAYLTARLMGWDLRKSADGGSGYQTATSGGGVANTFLDRIVDFDGIDLDAMLFAGGINDSATGLQAAAAAVFARFRTAHPTVPMYVLGPWSPSSSYQTANAAKWTAIQAACAAHDGIFIDNRGWITDANAVVLISDGTHPSSPAGTSYAASRIQHAILANLGSL